MPADIRLAIRCLASATIIVALSACGSYSGGPTDATTDSNSSTGAQARSMEEHFTGNVQPNLDFCRTCHVPGGIADVENGHDFMLSATRSQDMANLRASWELLGKNNPTSRILLMSSDQETPHTGGAPWPVASAGYKNMEILLKCFGDPAGCAALLAGGASGGTLWPLLAEGHRGGHAWSSFCEGKADEAVLPPDPRSLVQPGISEGKAVYFNAYWNNCHVYAGPDDAAPTSCGQWRQRVERGSVLMKGNGAQGAAVAIGGNSIESSRAIVVSSADAYANLWRTWGAGFNERPGNFDQLNADRWGAVLGTVRNPYPLPGEDPDLTDGGSGQLPTMLTQVRNADGSWSGKIGFTCHMCHSGEVGLPGEPGTPGPIYGTSSLMDTAVMGRDLLTTGNVLGAAWMAAFTNRVRGVSNIDNAQFFGVTTLFATNGSIQPESLLKYLLLQTSDATGSQDAPVWWNYGHRPRKFFDGFMPSDAQRIVVSAFLPALIGMGNAYEWVEQHDQDAVAWLLNLKSPAWPDAVDTALAEQGAILFHSKNLWAVPGNAGVERPKGGNGSCASCHGAYSPRFVHDPNYLQTPELEGIAGYIVPRNLIGTDPARVDGNDQAVAQSFENNFFTYPEQAGTDQDCQSTNLDSRRGDRENGYLAPPLYGVWATAPYFHNGSVPNIWEVLKSSDRKPIWRRVSKPKASSQNVVTGFDTSFSRAYDRDKLGWKYEEVDCANGILTGFLECNSQNPGQTTLGEQLLSAIYSNLGLSWNLAAAINTPLTTEQIEQRKVFNTSQYSQSNAGHTFTDVLTDQERRAVIEYLKTL